MTCVTIPSTYHDTVLKYIHKHLQASIPQFIAHVDAEYSCTFVPHFGSYEFTYQECSMLINYNEEGQPRSTFEGIQYYRRLTITSLDIELVKEFITKAIEYEKASDDINQVHLYTSSYRGIFSNAGTMYTQSMDRVYIPPCIKTELIDTIDKFLASRKRYETYGRLYKTSFLLTGPPGSGKTSFVKAIALKYKRPIYVLNFTKQMTDEDFINLMTELKKDSILLVEDIDAFFIDRSTMNINISFSCFINFLDGTLGKGNGIITFITANNPDRLDHAMIRPGRIDRIVRFDYPKKKEIHTAYMDLVDDATEPSWNAFWERISLLSLSMSGIVDYLFRYHCVEAATKHIEELVAQTKLVNEIVHDKTEKMYQ